MRDELLELTIAVENSYTFVFTIMAGDDLPFLCPVMCRMAQDLLV
jgi:hypothetical protein